MNPFLKFSFITFGNSLKGTFKKAFFSKQERKPRVLRKKITVGAENRNDKFNLPYNYMVSTHESNLGYIGGKQVLSPLY